MILIARIDTPWTVNGDGQDTDRPLVADVFALKSWKDVTGEDWHTHPTTGESVIGGNYAKETVDPTQDRQGKFGDPDYLIIEAQIPDRETAEQIDDDPRFHVYADVEAVSGRGVNDFSTAYDYTSGSGPSVPAPGEMYWRLSADLLRINKESLDGPVAANLSALTAGDRVSVGVEEYWQLMGQETDRGDYVEWSVSNLQRGRTGVLLQDGVRTFDFNTGLSWRRPDHYPDSIEWDELLAKFNNRGYPAGWVDANFGTNRNRLRANHERTMAQALVETQV